jgi:hypothetical protein
MKLDANTITYIQNVVKTAKLVNIDSFIIEPNLVRGLAADNSAVIVHSKDVPDMPFGSIGMNRLDIFTARFEVLKTQPNFSMEVDIDADQKCVRSIIMKAKGSKVDYKCARPAAIKAAKQLHETFKHRVVVNAESVVLLHKAVAAMSSPEHVTLISNSDGVSLELCDINNDVFKHTFMDKVETLTPDANGKFAHRYFVKTLLPLLKQNANGQFDVGMKGTLAFNVNGITTYVLSQV